MTLSQNQEIVTSKEMLAYKWAIHLRTSDTLLGTLKLPRALEVLANDKEYD